MMLQKTQFADEEIFPDVKENRTKFYKEENAKFESTFSQCKLLNEPSSSCNWDADWNMKKEIEQLCTAQEHFNSVDLDAAQLAMSYVDREFEKTNYVEKLRSETNLFMGLNDELLRDVKILSSKVEEAKKKLEEFNMLYKDPYLVDKKILAYRNDLAKMEKKHTWLKNPQIDLTYIAKEAQSLASMQEEKEALEKELDIYQGLKPDLKEASHQLSVVKKQYKELKDKFHQGV